MVVMKSHTIDKTAEKHHRTFHERFVIFEEKFAAKAEAKKG